MVCACVPLDTRQWRCVWVIHGCSLALMKMVSYVWDWNCWSGLHGWGFKGVSKRDWTVWIYYPPIWFLHVSSSVSFPSRFGFLVLQQLEWCRALDLDFWFSNIPNIVLFLLVIYSENNSNQCAEHSSSNWFRLHGLLFIPGVLDNFIWGHGAWKICLGTFWFHIFYFVS